MVSRCKSTGSVWHMMSRNKPPATAPVKLKTAAAANGALFVNANCALETVATAKPKVSKDNANRPTFCVLPSAMVMINAPTTGANNHGDKTQGGCSPMKTFLNVPPERDATAAMRRIPPKSKPLLAATLAPTKAKANVEIKSRAKTKTSKSIG